MPPASGSLGLPEHQRDWSCGRACRGHLRDRGRRGRPPACRGAATTRSRPSSRTPARSSRATSCRSRASRSGKVTDINLTPNGHAEAHAEASTRTTRRCARAPRRRSARPRSRASPTATSTCASRPRAAPPIHDGGVIGTDAHHDRRRPRPVLQHLRRQDPPVAAAPDPRLRRPSTRAGRGRPTPAGSTSTRRWSAASRAVPRAQPRHRRCSTASSRPTPTWSPTSPPGATTSPGSSTTSRRPPARSARQQRRPADAIGRLPPFMRRANTTFVNLRARSTTSSPRRRLQAGGPQARPVPASSCARWPSDAQPDDPRPLGADPPRRAPTTT